jgi:uncharacterized protein YecE (DUF72 family)
MVGKIHIGTSGWSYKHWKDDFYPKGLKQAEWFSYYTGIFKITEINTSFYHLPLKETVKNWVKKAPKDFSFALK